MKRKLHTGLRWEVSCRNAVSLCLPEAALTGYNYIADSQRIIVLFSVHSCISQKPMLLFLTDSIKETELYQRIHKVNKRILISDGCTDGRHISI